MAELRDYSGPFNPDLQWEDCSKELLIRVMKVWQYFYLEMASAWYDAVEKSSGSEEANACEFARTVSRAASRRPNRAGQRARGYETGHNRPVPREKLMTPG